MSQVQYTTGTIALGRGRYARAARARREALATARAAADREAEALALHGLAEALAFTGPLPTPLAHAVACSCLVRSLGWLPMLHHDENMRGWILLWMGRLPEAEDALRGAGQGVGELGDPRNAAHALVGRGHVRCQPGDTARAWDLYRRAEQLKRRLRGPRTLLRIKVHELHPLVDERRWADVRTEQSHALAVELAARIGTDDADRLAEIGRALLEVGAHSSAARARRPGQVPHHGLPSRAGASVRCRVTRLASHRNRWHTRGGILSAVVLAARSAKVR